ncbi:uncharacterized protein LOC124635382 [Helicoverpa zea]|uniref:uncharacterized protein LOC124635382 n=1 Tax=Helicoverpa zea TaxID=7113 RepID=UPI001F5A54D0|nr:uncharacterized protein LOC124635382 [Helicoverpa zea]
MATQSTDSRAPKRVSSGRYTNDDEQIEDWLNELEEEHEFCDFDDSVEDPYYVEENVQQEENEDLEEQNIQSSESDFNSEDEEPFSFLVCGDQDGANYIGKNGFLWSKKEGLRSSCPGTKLRRGDFLLSLARELVLPGLKERVYNDRLPRELRLTIT